MIIQSEFIQACLTPSDINEHLPTLYDLAKKCTSVTELGVRDGVSTRAFLFSGVKFRSYDLYLDPTVKSLFDTVRQKLGTDVEYLIGNSLEISIDLTDLLFIDTKHTYQQLSQELERHYKQVRRFIVLHDMESFGRQSEDGTRPGLIRAVEEFVEQHRNWKIKSKFKNNNGLWILESHG
mgnify:CR=1 FL=1